MCLLFLPILPLTSDSIGKMGWRRDTQLVILTAAESMWEAFLQLGEGKNEKMDGREQKRLRIVIYAETLSF